MSAFGGKADNELVADLMSAFGGKADMTRQQGLSHTLALMEANAA